jgi:hypothetical protein
MAETITILNATPGSYSGTFSVGMLKLIGTAATLFAAWAAPDSEPALDQFYRAARLSLRISFSHMVRRMTPYSSCVCGVSVLTASALQILDYAHAVNRL